MVNIALYAVHFFKKHIPNKTKEKLGFLTNPIILVDFVILFFGQKVPKTHCLISSDETLQEFIVFLIEIARVHVILGQTNTIPRNKN